jgi:hypothetical protein
MSSRALKRLDQRAALAGKTYSAGGELLHQWIAMYLLHFQNPAFATKSQLEVQLKDCRPAVLVILVAF